MVPLKLSYEVCINSSMTNYKSGSLTANPNNADRERSGYGPRAASKPGSSRKKNYLWLERRAFSDLP